MTFLAAAATLIAAALALASPAERGGEAMPAGGRADLRERQQARQHHLRVAMRRARRGPSDRSRGSGVQGPGSMTGAPAGSGGTVGPSQGTVAPAGEDAPAADDPVSAPPEPPAGDDELPPVEQPPVKPPDEEPVVGDPVTDEPGTDPAVDPGKDTAEVEPAKPLTPTDPTAVPLTIGVDGGYAGWSDTEVAERTVLGAAVTRHEWDPTEPVAEQDDVVEVAAGRIHTRIHALLGGNELGDPTNYMEWVVAFIRRYGVGGGFWAAHPELDESRYAITSVELGNEPYFGAMSPAEYADTVRPALEEIRRLGLPVTVMIPAYVYGDDAHWIEAVVEKIPDLAPLIDGLAFHPYWYGHHPATSGWESPIGRIGTLRRLMNELGFGSKRIYLTEYGESTASCGEECVNEAEQATHLSAMIEAVLAHPEWRVGLLCVFQLRDRGTLSPDRELQFGLLRQDGTPKPAYPVVTATMQAFR